MACLNAFLGRAEGRRFQPGEWDCCLMVADWVRENTGIDGAAPWRGRYQNVRGYLRHLKSGGGVEGVVTLGANLTGLTETASPKRGDIGVIEGGKGRTGAICLGTRWAAVGAFGLVVLSGPAIKAWRVQHG